VCGYSELYRKEGWLVPGLDGAKKKMARAAVPGKPGMYLTILEPAKRASSIQVFQCSQAHVGRLEMADIAVAVGDVYAFDVGGRIFAYGVVYGIDGIAAEWHIMFYDVDGSGRFTVRRSERSRFVPDSTPDWIKELIAR